MQDIDAEVQKLIEMLNGFDPLEVPLEESLQAVVKFFERLLHASQSVPPENQKDWPAKIVEIAQKIQGALKKFSDATGMSEEDLLHYADNGENFPKEKWEQYQEARKIVAGFAKNIALSQTLAQAPEGQKPEGEAQASDRKKPIQPKRSTWMKS